MAGYTKEDMRNIYRRGIMWGLRCDRPAGMTIEQLVDDMTENFEHVLRVLREEKEQAAKPKPNVFNPEKALEKWDGSGRQQGMGVIEGLLPPKR